MYQAIYYNHQTYTYHLRDDKQGWMDFQLQPTFWKRVPEWQENARPVLTGGWAISNAYALCSLHSDNSK